MLHRNIADLGGFRRLDGGELLSIAGGEIVVTGTRYADPWVTSISGDDLQFFLMTEGSGGMQNFEQLGGGGGGGGSTGDGEWVDSDGDGEGDTIVVTAPERVELVDGYYAYVYDTSHWDIYQDAGWLLALFGVDDSFIGHFQLDPEGGFVIKDAETSVGLQVTVPVQGTPVTVEGTYTDTPQTEYRLSPTDGGYHDQYTHQQ